MAIKTFKYFDAGVGFKDQASDTITTNGVIYRNGNSLKLYIENALRNIVTDSQSQTLTNKTISGANNTITNIPVTALTAIIDTDLNTVSALDDTIPSAKATKAYVDAQVLTKDAASEIAFTPAGTIAATNVQAAVEEVSGDIETHKGLATGAHAASAITNTPAGNIAAITVQAALNELDTEKAPLASPTFTGTVSGITAAMVGAPAGSGTSTGTNTGDQINISGNAATVTTNANLTGHITSVGNTTSLGSFTSAQLATALTDETGSGANVFGTSPTITSASIVTPSRLDMKKDTKSNLTTYAATAADGQLVFATDTLETFVIKSSALSAVGGAGGVGSVDFLSVDQADLSALTDYTQTGLEILESPSPILHGTKSFRLQHTTSIKSFKKVIVVDRKFRGKNNTLTLDVVSSATSGNLNIIFRDETNSANIGVSQIIATGSQAITATTASSSNQLTGMTNTVLNSLKVGMIITGSAIPVGTTITAISSTAATMSQNATGVSTGIRISDLPSKKTFSFDIPTNCASVSWTISSVVEVYAESYLDDLVLQLTSTALSSTSISQTTFNATSWTAYTPTFTGFGTPSAVEFEYRQIGENYEIRGKFASGTSTATEARISLPNSATSAGISIIPSISVIGNFAMSSVNGFAGEILIEPATSYITFGAQGTSLAGLSKLTASSFISSGQSLSFFASVPIAGLTANTTTTTTIPLTSAQLVQTPDSAFRIDNNLTASTFGSTATAVRRFTTIRENIGSAFQFLDDSVNGSRIVILEAGIFSISYTDAFVGQPYMAITKNASSLTTNPPIMPNDQVLSTSFQATATSNISTSWTGYLNVGDIIRAQATPSAAGQSSQVSGFSIAKQSGLKQLNPSSDSKITIPTHQLRFEGASTRGSTDTAIVKFDTQAITQGDGFSVVNTAANGTVITMQKAGKLTVDCTIYLSISTNMAITLNATNLATYARDTTYIQEMAIGSSAAVPSSMAKTLDVKVGDKIRIHSNASPNVLSSNEFSLSLTETSIPANFSNVLPQWSQSDSSVRLNTANGYGSTNNMIRRFSNTVQNIGSDIIYQDSATLGASFTAVTSGIYSISYNDQISSASFLGISLNTTAPTTAINSIPVAEVLVSSASASANLSEAMSWTGYLNAGDVIRPHDSGQSSGASTTVVQFTMAKVGKPNLTSVDVTPFVNMKTTDVEAIEALTATSTFGSTNTGVPVLNITRNTNLGVIRVDSSAANGTSFVALKDCEIKISATATTTVNGTAIYITKNSSTQVLSDPSPFLARTIGYSGSPQGTVSAIAKISTGDIIRVQSNATFTLNSVTLTATADNNATASPTQQVSSDTMSFAFKATAIDSAVDPVGTFNTYTYGSANTTAISTSAPTQTTSSMNINGIFITARPFGGVLGSATPARFDIFIGKGLKSKQVDAYVNLAKANAMTIDKLTTATLETGTTVHYNETTGILILDAGAAILGGVTRSVGYDIPTQALNASGYFVFNASKSPSLVTVPNLQQRVAYLSDVKASGTAGGTSVATTYQTRTLNTLVDSTGLVTSLASNQFTLPSGTYKVEANSCQFASNRNKLRLRNITDAITALVGSNNFGLSTANGGSEALMSGEITITSSKVFELQHYMETANASLGFGTAVTSGENEIYSVVKITKIK